MDMAVASTLRKEANAAVQAVVDQLIHEGREIGMQVAAYLNGKLVIDVWGGLADETTGRQVDADTLFNVFSVTKAITATALHLQVDRGLIEYDQPIARYWPEFAVHGKGKATVRDALTHRVGTPQMPEGVTPDRMCDWNWMTSQIAQLKPLFEPGTRTAYLSMTFGWIIGELVRRTDPQQRPIGQFIREELAQPLGITDLWVGIPDEVEPRIARLTHVPDQRPPETTLYAASMPANVDLIPGVFELPQVRRAPVAGVGGIFNARSCARFWGMLANGGELDGVRLLSEKLVRTFNTPRANSDELDPVMFGIPLPLSIAGYWLGGDYPPVASPKYPHVICHPGAGGSMGWADFKTGLAVAYCKNRMFNAHSLEEDHLTRVADAVRKSLGLE